MFNEFPYTSFEKINLDWLLDLGNKLKADAENGEFDGPSGYSPTVTVTDITGGHRVTITDLNGNHTFDVMDGTGGGGSVTVDNALSGSSTNPVQNKVIKTALDAKGTYTKPSGGIPASDLASAVQTSLGKADSALQAVPSTYRTAAAQDTIDAGKVDTADYSPEAKTVEMTQPVGKDSSGKLWTVPGSSGEEIISNANVLLASGTADAGITSAAVGDGLVDTGLTLGDLRQYKYIYIKIRLDDNNTYLGFRIGNANYQYTNSNAIYMQFTWLDNAKTALMPISCGTGNSGIAGNPRGVANNISLAMNNSSVGARQWLGAISIGSAADTDKIYVGITNMNGVAETKKSMIWGVFGMGAYSL